MSAVQRIRNVARRAGVELSRYPGQLPRARLAQMLQLHHITLVLDVGANTGQYAASLREFGYRGQILSFEPMSREYDALAANARHDSHWEGFHYALGDRSGRSEINISRNSISSSLRPMLSTHSEVVPDSAYTGTEEIVVERLDDVFDGLVGAHTGIFLKIDTQGFEREVLAGAERSIDRITGMQLETSFVPLYDGQMLLAETLRLTETYGMTLEGVEPGFIHEDGRMFQMDGIFFRPLGP
jgi:FkbM family methyltransferase